MKPADIGMMRGEKAPSGIIWAEDVQDDDWLWVFNSELHAAHTLGVPMGASSPSLIYPPGSEGWVQTRKSRLYFVRRRDYGAICALLRCRGVTPVSSTYAYPATCEAITEVP